MSKNVTEMKRIWGVSGNTVLAWIRKGYCGEVRTDPHGYYLLSDDLPRPYRSNGRVEKDSSLLKCLLEASDSGCSVHAAMFPRVGEFRFGRMLDFAVQSHLVETREPVPGVVQLLSTAEGRAVLGAKAGVQDKILDMLVKGISLATALAEFAIHCAPQIAQTLQNTA